MPSPTAKASRAAWIATALCATAYLYVFPYYPRINNPNENVRLYMTAAIVEQGTYRIDDLRRRWGWVNDAAVHEGHHYSVKAPGTSLLGVPGYALYRWLAGEDFDRTTALWVVRVTATVLPMLVFAWFFHRWLGARTMDPTLRDAVFLSVMLGSLLLGYSYLFVSHATAAAATFGAFMALHRAHEQRVGLGTAFLAGLLTAGATFFEYPGFVASVVLSVWALFVLRPWNRLLAFAAGGLPPTLAVMHFQWRAFGSPFTPGHLMVENPAFRRAHESGFFGADRFYPEAAAGLLFDLRWGLITLTPILALAAVGVVTLARDPGRRGGAITAVSVVALTYLTISFMNNWTGGWSMGPRYLAPVVPFVGWAALAGLDAIAPRAPRWAAVVAVGATLAAFVASGLPSMYYPHIPPAIEHPLPQLFALLLRHDYAPHNALNLAGIHGTVSMAPMAALGLVAAAWALGRRRPVEWLGCAASALLLAALLVIPLARPPEGDAPRASRAVAFVTRHWSPRGHDLASRLERHVKGPAATFDDWRRLTDVYAEEGRLREAEATRRRLRRWRPAEVP